MEVFESMRDFVVENIKERKVKSYRIINESYEANEKAIEYTALAKIGGKIVMYQKSSYLNKGKFVGFNYQEIEVPKKFMSNDYLITAK